MLLFTLERHEILSEIELVLSIFQLLTSNFRHLLKIKIVYLKTAVETKLT